MGFNYMEKFLLSDLLLQYSLTKDKIYYEINQTKSPLSDTISKDLKRKGMSFVGSITIYSYLQAIGIIYSHDKDCFMYKDK